MRLFSGQGSSSDSLGRQMSRATAWSSANSVVLRLANFAVGIVAARLIAPDQFGVFAVAITVHAIILNASDVGVSAYIVRRRGSLDSVGPTVTTLAFSSALLLALLMAASAPWLSAELGAANAVDPVRILSLTVVLAGVSAVPAGVLTREFRQDKRFAADLAYFVVSTAVLLVVALMGGGALALAWSRVGGQLISTLVLIAASPLRYRPGLDRRELRSVLNFGLPLVGASMIGFLVGNVDFIVVGRLLGAEPLGLYYLAFNIGSWPFMVLGPIVASISVAAFSRVRADRGQFANRMATAMSTLVTLALPASALIASLAVPLVHVVYGARWAPAAGALALTAIYGALRVPADLFTSIAIAEGRTRRMLLLQIAYLVALAPLTVVAVNVWGIAGAGVAHIVANAAVLLPGFLLILARSTGFGPRRFGAAVARPVVASIATGLVAHIVAAQIDKAWLAIVAGALAGLAVYFLLMVAWARALAARARGLWTDPEDAEDVDEDRAAIGNGGSPLVATVSGGAHV